MRTAPTLLAGLIAAASVACSRTIETGGTVVSRTATSRTIVPCPDTGADSDRDGLAESCEFALAGAFAPLLAVTPGQCLASEGLPPGGYLYGAEPIQDGVRVVYLFAYFMDCGWAGPKCRLPGVDCSGHAGDSEFLALDVSRGEGDGWSVQAIFLSAHCFGRLDRGCRWYRGQDLRDFSWSGSPLQSAPIVWVSEGRNANYPSRSACDRGYRYLDTCDRNAVRTLFPVSPTRNIGNRLAPIHELSDQPGCVEGRVLADSRARFHAIECFWTDDPFRGWQEHGMGSTPYIIYLERIAAF